MVCCICEGDGLVKGGLWIGGWVLVRVGNGDIDEISFLV